MTTWTRRGFLGSLSATATAAMLAAQKRRTGELKIKITDLRCAIIGRNPVVRIVTDQGISGYGEAESSKAYLKPMVLFYKDYLLGEDPTDVERVMLKIRRLGAFKPWGSAVSAIEIALWDIAGQAAGVPVYKLLGGKIRDRVRIYNGGNRNFILRQVPHIGRLLDSTINETLSWADQVVIAQKQSPEILKQIEMSGLPVTNVVA